MRINVTLWENYGLEEGSVVDYLQSTHDGEMRHLPYPVGMMTDDDLKEMDSDPEGSYIGRFIVSKIYGVDKDGVADIELEPETVKDTY